RVAGEGVPETDGGGDVAGVDLRDVFAVVGVHLQQATDALPTVLAAVGDIGTGGKFAGVDAEVGKAANEWVGHNLKGQRGKGGILIRLDRDRLFAAGDDALNRGNVQRRRQEGDDGVEHRLD